MNITIENTMYGTIFYIDNIPQYKIVEYDYFGNGIECKKENWFAVYLPIWRNTVGQFGNHMYRDVRKQKYKTKQDAIIAMAKHYRSSVKELTYA